VQTSRGAEQLGRLDLNVSVLTFGSWPAYPVMDVAIPPEVRPPTTVPLCAAAHAQPWPRSDPGACRWGLRSRRSVDSTSPSTAAGGSNGSTHWGRASCAPVFPTCVSPLPRPGGLVVTSKLISSLSNPHTYTRTNTYTRAHHPPTHTPHTHTKTLSLNCMAAGRQGAHCVALSSAGAAVVQWPRRAHPRRDSRRDQPRFATMRAHPISAHGAV
jgi:hypothetical protein